MESLLSTIIEYLYAVGPVVVFVVAGIETAFFEGLLVPAEATVLLADLPGGRGRSSPAASPTGPGGPVARETMEG